MPKRYFENPFSDLAPGQEVEIKRELWETRIRELVESIKRSDGSPDTPDKYDGGLYVGRAGEHHDIMRQNKITKQLTP